MNEGNCWTCGFALHTKHVAVVHPVQKILPDGSPVRGLEKAVHLCGGCLASGEDHAMHKFKKTAPAYVAEVKAQEAAALASKK